MIVKGVAVASVPLFLKEKFGEEGYEKWFNMLPPESQKIFTSKILSGTWYPTYEAIANPTKIMCEMYYNGDERGAWEAGRFSADYGLRGVYKMFVKMGSPTWLLDRACKAFAQYYDAKAELFRDAPNKARFLISGLFEPTRMVANRVGGWVERAQEVNGAKNITMFISKHEMGKDPHFEITGSWD